MDANELPEACRNVVNDLSRYLDGEISAERRAEIEQHLATCVNCHAVVDTVRKTLQLYHALPSPEFSSAARERLYRALALNGFLPPAK